MSDRFVKIDAQKFGIVKGVTDRGHYTNSQHVPVEYECTAQHKIDVEAPYHQYCNGGHILYVEMPGQPLGNTEGLLNLIMYARQADVGYLGINYPADYCKDCGYNGTFNDACPRCDSTNARRTRRVTGYFSVEERIGPGKEDEIANRVIHLGATINAEALADVPKIVTVEAE